MRYFQSFDTMLNENGPPTEQTDANQVNAVQSVAKTDAVANTDNKAPDANQSAAGGLQGKLKQWVEKYSQAFKFLNDKPIATEASKNIKGQYAMLVNVIVAENRQLIKEAITSIIDILSNLKFKGYDVQIIGHTSTSGPKGREKVYNQALSERRAGIVRNAILENAQETKKSLAHIKFTTLGKGLTDPIILNDQTLDPLKVKSMDGNLSEPLLASLLKSKEERQKINRRVIITLPNYKEPVPEVKAQVPVKSQDAPQKLDTSDITFNPDSYFLTERGKSILDKVVEHVVSRAAGAYRVKDIYVSAHTEIMSGGDKRESMMYILSLNRAYSVKFYLEKKLKEKNNKEPLNYIMYGCGSKLPLNKGDVSGFDDEKRVQLTFDTDLPNAKEVYNQMQEKFNLKAQNSIIANKKMEETIIEDVNVYFADDSLRQDMITKAKRGEGESYLNKIPRELWISATDNPYTATANTEDDPTRIDGFVGQIKAIFKKMKDRHNVSITPSVLFHKDLVNWLQTHPDKDTDTPTPTT